MHQWKLGSTVASENILTDFVSEVPYAISNFSRDEKPERPTWQNSLSALIRIQRPVPTTSTFFTAISSVYCDGFFKRHDELSL